MARRTRSWLVGIVGMNLDDGRRVVARCERESIPVYFPLYREIEIESGRKRLRIKPLWPGYVFVGEAAVVRGIGGYLKTELGYSRMRDAILRAICFERHDADGFVKLSDIEPDQRFRLGQLVREIGSSFSSGMWNGMSDDGRHRVLYNLLGRHVEALVEDALLLGAAA